MLNIDLLKDELNISVTKDDSGSIKVDIKPIDALVRAYNASLQGQTDYSSWK